MDIIIKPGGEANYIYGEAIDLAGLGTLRIRRASYVEPTEDGRWTADLKLVDGPLLGPFKTRSEAIAAETAWLNANWFA